MNELHLHALRCPQCGAPGAVREGTRITECERCGVRLCVTGTVIPRYELEARLTAEQAVDLARAWLRDRGFRGEPGRPEPILIPFHEIAGRRTGVFQRKVPKRRRVQRVREGPNNQPQIETRWIQEEEPDTKVLLSDVGHITAAARTPWNLDAFDARAARRSTSLRPFDLSEAQRRATVLAQELSPTDLAERRFAGSGETRIVALSQRTLYFPFWSIPVLSEGGGYELLIDGVRGLAVSWELPEPFPERRWPWLGLAVPGALALGLALRGLLLGDAPVAPGPSLGFGALASGAALWWSARPDWRVRRGPDGSVRAGAVGS